MRDPFAKNDIKIAVLGGGTGSFMMLSALKKHTKQIAAIVSMADDGGSTGVLRDEFGTLPSGDVRKCLVALSDSSKVRDLFNYRFDCGTLCGHSFGNILLTALEKISGSFSEAVETASEILAVNGMVIPATLDDVRLTMQWPEAKAVLNGERVIDANFFKYDPRRAVLSLSPKAEANPLAVKAIEDADLVIISPGDLYTSLGPLLIIDGIADALKNTKAICVYVANLVTKQGQTTGFTVNDHADEIERFVGEPFLDYVIYNEQMPKKDIEKKYRAEGAYVTKIDRKKLKSARYKAVPGDFLGAILKRDKADVIPATRSLIRHDAAKVCDAVIDLFESLED